MGKEEVLELKEKHGVLKTLEILKERQDLLRFQKKELQFKQKHEKFYNIKENNLKLFSQPINPLIKLEIQLQVPIYFLIFQFAMKPTERQGLKTKTPKNTVQKQMKTFGKTQKNNKT